MRLSSSPSSGLSLLTARILALVVTANFCLVIFDLSYIKFREYYLKIDQHQQQSENTPQNQYLQQIDQLEKTINQFGIESQQVKLALEQIQTSSVELFIKNPPFPVLNSSGTLAEIQKRFQNQVKANNFQQALELFWSPVYFNQKTWKKQLLFFNQNIRFLIIFYEPSLTYDLIKGVEPDRLSQNYLRKVSELKVNLKYNGLNHPKSQSLLKEIRQISIELIDRNYPLQLQPNLGKLTEIKYRIIDHIYGRDPQFTTRLTPTLKFLYQIKLLNFLAPELIWSDRSAKQAFNTFWSLENLEQYGWETELQFFEAEMQELMQLFYFRHLGIDGEFVNRFWLIDLPWITLFFLTFLMEIYALRRRQPELTLREAILKLWYYLFLLIPKLLFLRFISAVYHLNRANFPRLQPTIDYLKLKFIYSFAQELIQVLVNQGVNQVQSFVKKGAIKNLIGNPASSYQALDFVDLTQQVPPGIPNRIVELTITQVLPSIHPELEAYVHYQVSQSIQKSPIYKGLNKIPGVRHLPQQVANNVAQKIAIAISENPKKSLEEGKNKPPDFIAMQLQKQLTQKFVDQLRIELNKEQIIDDVETILVNWLDKLKSNQVKDLEAKSSIKPANIEVMKQISPTPD
ncbi:hypothetical protein PCC9214_02510 [Planktothrix tepida]|uniref:Uncharacterized protein n=2 Tax=Planktothrix TaxID=54304 RepID=A0A1J1LKV3_9CYAN|nr:MULTISPECIES: hypothetical protein [Planktothrix]CAD5950293.1 hypothetical protein PCC9214_02510 [Planktothrix tepida]CAD5960452.1 hypothetical protein NO713_03163 [Planktothrix pseudagardhii]CUR32556.1 conserved membrane hypothetical protein [Planktothrix tepida PCC 9214]